MLLSAGYTPRQLTDAVRARKLTRVRRGFYSQPDAPAHLQHAARIGGVAGCVSAAGLHGIWVGEAPFAHVWMRHEASRMRTPRNRFQALATDNRDGCELHWWPLLRPTALTLDSVDVVDCLAQMVRCQPSRFAIAAIDSALNLSRITAIDVAQMFSMLPRKYRPLAAQVDGSAESGLETIVRLQVRNSGRKVRTQVEFHGIGTVDLLVEDCVVVELDGYRGHGEPESRAKDYARDAMLVSIGYIVLRFGYSQVMFQPELVARAIEAALRLHPRGPR